MKKLLTLAIVILLSSITVKSYAQTSTFSIYNAAYYVDSIRVVPGGSSGSPITLSPSQTMQPITLENGPYSFEFYFSSSSSVDAKVTTSVTSDWYSPSSSDSYQDPYTRVAVAYAYFGEGWYYSFTVH